MGFGAAGSLVLGVAAGAAMNPLVLVGLPFILVPGLTVACHRFLNSPSDQPSPFVVKITDMR